MTQESFTNKLLTSFLIFIFLGCQPLQSEHPVVSGREGYIEVPEELKEQVYFSESIGELIYLKDKAAEIATDILIYNGLLKNKDTTLRGWITVKDDDGAWKVIFISEMEGGFKGHYSVKIRDHKVVKRSFKNHNAALDLTSKQLSMFKARQLAISQNFRRCSINYNTVVIPHEDEETGEKYFYVYLLTASDAGDIPVIGHHRVKVSQNGDTVLEFTSLSNTCMSLPPGGTIRATFHMLGPTPIETHVFFSLQQGYSLEVITVQNRLEWQVDGNQIRLLHQF
jgi:hypothetical protein